MFAPPIGHVADWKSLLLMASPGHPCQGMLNPVEGGRWSVTLCTADGEPAPTDHAGLLRAAGNLRHPLLRELIQAATPLGPVYGCTHGENRWRHYQKLRRWPDQYLVVGDAGDRTTGHPRRIHRGPPARPHNGLRPAARTPSSWPGCPPTDRAHNSRRIIHCIPENRSPIFVYTDGVPIECASSAN
ncbi:hypothetical protein [Streptomyces sp. NPDC048521]|uniref:hypothetical protein n=1 Tax=Streptomyces sp. NPDC048521 TaxID=3365566 RepID=UPI003719D785